MFGSTAQASAVFVSLWLFHFSNRNFYQISEAEEAV